MKILKELTDKEKKHNQKYSQHKIEPYIGFYIDENKFPDEAKAWQALGFELLSEAFKEMNKKNHLKEMTHNHMTRDIKKFGICPECDKTILSEYERILLSKNLNNVFEPSLKVISLYMNEDLEDITLESIDKVFHKLDISKLNMEYEDYESIGWFADLNNLKDMRKNNILNLSFKDSIVYSLAKLCLEKLKSIYN